jgi:hypothetical protein
MDTFTYDSSIHRDTTLHIRSLYKVLIRLGLIVLFQSQRSSNFLYRVANHQPHSYPPTPAKAKPSKGRGALRSLDSVPWNEDGERPVKAIWLSCRAVAL